MITISTVTPIYSGENFLNELILAIDNTRNYIQTNFVDIQLIESIFVIDDAIDNSASLLRTLSNKHNWIKVIELSQNYGQHSATAAGILYSSGDWIFTIDEDLQHPPKLFVSILKDVISNSGDIGYVISSRNVHNSIVKDGLAKLFKTFISFLTSNYHIKHFSSFRLIRGQIARAASAAYTHESYFDVILTWYSNRICPVKLNLIDRRNQDSVQKSNYSTWGLIRHGKRMLFTSNLKIFRLGILIGVCSFILSLALIAYSVISRLFSSVDFITEWSSLMIALLFFSGVISLISGMILETQMNQNSHLKGKPAFFVIDRTQDEHLRKIISGEL